MESLIAARNSLRQSLDKSRELACALDKTGPRLDDIQRLLPCLKAAVRPVRARKEALVAAGGHIDRAVGPAAAVLKVFDAVHGLEKLLLSDPRGDLERYLKLMKQLEDALKFLSDNCALAIQWLEDIVEYLEKNFVADERYLLHLRESLKSLRCLHCSIDRGPLDGGLLDAALDKLIAEFSSLVADNSVILPMSWTLFDEECDPCLAPSPLPVTVIRKLQLILERLSSTSRCQTCLSIYIEVRTLNIRASLQALDLEYLEMTVSEFEDVQCMETYIAKWGKHLEFAVKHLFEAEYNLCRDVFENMGAEVWLNSFSEIASEAGILAFLEFGKTITESKKNPMKLLKLLDIFATFNNLRVDFNRLFGRRECVEIQNTTRDLIKAVIDGACEIFWDLLVQVELQRRAAPPLNGNVPKIVSFITDYCNTLLGDDYKPALTQVLAIQRTWKREMFQNNLLTDAILEVIRSLEQNLEAWSKTYEDTALSYLFLMNNHGHLYLNLKDTNLGILMGDAWLREQEQYREYYAAMYIRESWNKLPSLLSREGLILFSGGRSTARDLVKKRLKAFNLAFDKMHKKHSNWVIPDKKLRNKTCQVTIQAIVPVFRSYMQSYGSLLEQDASKYAKYTADTLECMIASLFQHKLGRFSSIKFVHSSQKLNHPLSSDHITSKVMRVLLQW